MSLEFKKDDYVIEEKVYKGQTIRYKLYTDIVYCEKPVDVKYETLNIKVPLSVDGQEIDTSNAPIFMGLGCAGLLSSTASSGGTFAPPPGGPGQADEKKPPKKASEISSSEEWEAMAGGEGHAGGGMAGIELLGSMPDQMGPPPLDEGEMAPPDGSRWSKLASGLIIVEVGCRGRENVTADGVYYGKAPAMVVDLKAAIRYMRHNKDTFPGDTEKIITSGGSGGGWQSTLLGASGNCAWFEPYLEEIGAAKERDDIFASYSTSPIIDHEYMDGGIEFQGGELIKDPKDKALSDRIKADFADYINNAGYIGRGGFGQLTSDNIGEYITKEYLIPDANRYLSRMSDEAKAEYLSLRPWLKYDEDGANFTFEQFGLYAPRNAKVPGVDDLAMEDPEPNLYGDANTPARHITKVSLELETGNPDAKVDDELMDIVHSQNPSWHIRQHNTTVAPHWWIRHGACDSCTSVIPVVLLASALESAGKDVNLRLVWDGGHCEDDDQDKFMQWIWDICR